MARPRRPRVATLKEVMAYLGSRRSPAKARAAVLNGRKGGRPRKKRLDKPNG